MRMHVNTGITVELLCVADTFGVINSVLNLSFFFERGVLYRVSLVSELLLAGFKFSEFSESLLFR